MPIWASSLARLVPAGITAEGDRALPRTNMYPRFRTTQPFAPVRGRKPDVEDRAGRAGAVGVGPLNLATLPPTPSKWDSPACRGSSNVPISNAKGEDGNPYDLIMG